MYQQVGIFELFLIAFSTMLEKRSKYYQIILKFINDNTLRNDFDHRARPIYFLNHTMKYGIITTNSRTVLLVCLLCVTNRIKFWITGQ